jgi:hypothetical protein
LALKFVGIDEVFTFLFRFEHHIVGVGKTVTSEDVFTDIVLQIVDILGVVKPKQFFFICLAGPVDIQFAIDVEAFD